jgi:hypothetical protein
MREAILRRDTVLSDYGKRPRGERWVLTRSAIEMYSNLFLRWQPFDYQEFKPGLVHIRTPEPGGEFRALLYNGLGTGYGDLICGSVFVRALHRWITSHGWTPKIKILPVPSMHLFGRYKEIFTRDPHVYGITFGGVPLDEFRQAHFALSNEALVADNAFDKVDMVEYFFHRGGLKNSPEDRAPEIYPDLGELEQGAAWVAKHKGPRLFVNFFGSGMRRVPCTVWRNILDPIIRDGWSVMFSFPPEARAVSEAFINNVYQNKRVYSVGAASDTWSKHVGIVAACNAVLCTDTSTTHVAAAVRVPSVTMFQFIDPDLRIKHYPKAKGWCPDVFRKGPWWGRSHPYPGWTEQTHDEAPDVVKPWKKTDLSGPARLLKGVLN